MENYKKEDLKLFNMDLVPLEKYTVDSPMVFEIEKTASIEEKIRFIDEQKDGVASYLIALLDKWENEKDALPKDAIGNVKTVSRKAWYKRNDDRKLMDRDYKIGSYYLFGQQYSHLTMVCPKDYGYKMTYTGENVVNQWYHDLLQELRREEEKHFDMTDSRMVKWNEVKAYAEKHRVYFDNRELSNIVWKSKKDVSEKNLDIYLKAYKELEQAIKSIENKLFQTLGSDSID